MRREHFEKMEEQIDILLASYNGKKYIEAQISSILNQTYKNIKLIISDDCSTDGTIDILKKYAQKDNRIQLYLQEKNLGVVKNIEFLLKNVTNNLYMLSDQDDVWLPEKIEKSVKYLKENDADLVFGDLRIVDEKLNTIYESFSKYMLLDRKINKYIGSKKLNYLYNCVTGCTVLSKKKFIKEILPLPAISKYMIHDHWIGLIISFNGKLAYMPEQYILYRQHGNNEVGTKKISHEMTDINEVRQLFINVKLGVFESYIKYNSKFPEELQKLNIKALEYYKMLNTKKKVNFEGWGTFHKLYKTEKFMYYIENFIILNMPCIGKEMFKLRLVILKVLKKR